MQNRHPPEPVDAGLRVSIAMPPPAARELVFDDQKSIRVGLRQILLCVGRSPGFVWTLACLAISSALSVSAIAWDTPTAPLRSACEVGYPPFSVVHEDGHADGFSVELMRAALARMGWDVTFRTGPWDEVKGWLERCEVDALPLVGRTPEREEFFDFTVPYMTMHGAIVVRKDTEDVHALADLRGRRVGVMKGDNAEEFLRREDRGIEIVATPTFADAFQALDEARCDAVVAQRLVALRLLDKIGLSDRLRVIERPIAEFAQDFCFAVKKGDGKTLALLNEGLALVVADGTRRRLHAKWFASLELPSDRPIVIGGDHNFPPFEFLDEKGRPAGFNVDLVRAVAEAIGLDIRIRLGSWHETTRALDRGDIDAIQGMFYSPERSQLFDFSPAHFVNHCVAVVHHESGPPPTSVADLAGKRLVVQRGDIMQEFCRQHGLADQLALADTQEEALRDVVEGRRDCALVARMTALYWIEREGWDTLVVGRTPLHSPKYCFAVPRGHQALLAHLGEGLATVKTSGEYQRIQDKWMGVYDERASGWRDAVMYVVLIAGPLLLIALLALLWSWGLRKQVARRTSELRESLARQTRGEERYRLLAENTIDLIWVMTMDARFTYVNPAIEPMFGFTPDEWIGSGLWEHCDERHFATMMALIEKETAKGPNQPGVIFETQMRRRDGSAIAVEIHGQVICDEQSAPVFLQGVTRDISERKRSEKVLRESETSLKEAQRLADIGNWAWDLQTDKLSMSDQMYEIIGLEMSPEALAVAAHETYYTPESWRRFGSAIETTREAGRSYEIELEVVRAGGGNRHVVARGEALKDVSGHVVALRGTLQDITERKSLQDQLTQAQKLESVGRLAGGVAHDFNNLIMGIMGYAELCRERIGVDHPIREWLDEIMHECQRSANLTRQLLAFARKQTIAPKVLDLNDAVGNMLKMLRRLIGEDIDLVWEPGAELWPVKVDPGQLDQILANLCVNARDAIAGAGKLTIETENASIDEAYCESHAYFQPGAYVMLAVSDDGCGMDRETLANIFEPFFTTKPTGEGTGLGLATVYGIVKQNGGFVNAYSELGKGTTLRIYLPRVAAETSEQARARPADSRLGGSETILLVEDEKSIRVPLRLFLEDLGYTVLAAESSEAALRLASERGNGIDLLFTDVVMPGMSGRELAEKLAPDHPEMKVLYMSGYTTNVIAHRGILDEGVHFVGKPISRDALAAKLRSILEQGE